MWFSKAISCAEDFLIFYTWIFTWICCLWFRESNLLPCIWLLQATLKLSFLFKYQDENGNKMINEYVRECKIGSGSYGKVVGLVYSVALLPQPPLHTLRRAVLTITCPFPIFRFSTEVLKMGRSTQSRWNFFPNILLHLLTRGKKIILCWQGFL